MGVLVPPIKCYLRNEQKRNPKFSTKQVSNASIQDLPICEISIECVMSHLIKLWIDQRNKVNFITYRKSYQVNWIESILKHPRLEKYLAVNEKLPNEIQIMICRHASNWKSHQEWSILPTSSPDSLKLVSAIFYQFFIFHQMIALQKF